MLDIIAFDRATFEKAISLSIKKKVKSKWKLERLENIAKTLTAGGDIPQGRISDEKTEKYKIPIYANSSKNKGLYGYTDIIKVNEPCVTVSTRGTIGYAVARNEPFYPIVRLIILIPKEEKAIPKYLELLLNKLNFDLYGAGVPQLTVPQISKYKIPLPPKEVQEEIVP